MDCNILFGSLGVCYAPVHFCLKSLWSGRLSIFAIVVLLHGALRLAFKSVRRLLAKVTVVHEKHGDSVDPGIVQICKLQNTLAINFDFVLCFGILGHQRVFTPPPPPGGEEGGNSGGKRPQPLLHRGGKVASTN